jgi:hypothetical protein
MKEGRKGRKEPYPEDNQGSQDGGSTALQFFRGRVDEGGGEGRSK